MRLTIRTAGLAVLCGAIAVAGVVIPVAALRANGTDAFNRLAGWATIVALPVLAVSVILLLWDKIADGGDGIDSSRAAGDLASIVMAQSAVARSRLIGAGAPGDQAANVRFARSAGRLREVGGARVGDLASVLKYYLSLSPRRLVVLGDAGAGKTALALELIVRLLEVGGNGEPGQPVPVLVSAAAFDDRLSWDDWLAEHLAARFGLRTRVTAALIRDGLILPVADGLDEMDLGSDSRRAEVLVAALNAAMRGRDRAPLVVTCRTGDYLALAEGIDQATHVEMLPLTGPEVARYLATQFRDGGERNRWASILAMLRADPSGPLAAQLGNPWRLTLALAAFRDAGDPVILAPALDHPAYPSMVTVSASMVYCLIHISSPPSPCTILLAGIGPVRSAAG